jgi:hypothetical protein
MNPGTGNSIKNGEAKLVIWTQVFHIGEIHGNCNLVMFWEILRLLLVKS